MNTNNFQYQWALETTTIYGMTPEEKAKRYYHNLEIDTLENKHLLVVGYGKGIELPLLKNEGAIITAIDCNKRDIEGIDTLQFDVIQFKPEQQFDYVYAYGVLHHTPDPKAYFMHLADLVKPGGKIFVWMYNRQRNTFLRKFNIFNWKPKNIMWVAKIQAVVTWPFHFIAHLLFNNKKRNLPSLVLRYYDSLCCENQYVYPASFIKKWFEQREMECKIDGEGYLGTKP
ncbi:MAG: methyltransferase type 11 [uncultured bacterium]|nr:MAG: methyltransferase type 11 [uncultured bacterium]